MEGEHDGMVSTIDSLLMGMAAVRVTGSVRPALADFTALLENLLAGQGDTWLANFRAGPSASPAESDGAAPPDVQGELDSLSDLTAVLLALINQVQQEPTVPESPVGDGELPMAGLHALVRAVETDPTTQDVQPGEVELERRGHDTPADEGKPAGGTVTDEERFQAVLALLAAAMPTAAPIDPPAQPLPTAPSTSDEPAEPVVAVAPRPPAGVTVADLPSNPPDRSGPPPERAARRGSPAPTKSDAGNLPEPARAATAEPGQTISFSQNTAAPAPARPAAPVNAAVTTIAPVDSGHTAQGKAATARASANRMEAPTDGIDSINGRAEPSQPGTVTAGAVSLLRIDGLNVRGSDEPVRQVVAPSTGLEAEGSKPVPTRLATTDIEAPPPAGNTGARPNHTTPSGPPPSAEPPRSVAPRPAEVTVTVPSHAVAARPALTQQAEPSDTPAPAETVDTARAPAPPAPASDQPTATEPAGSAPEPPATPRPAATGSALAGDRQVVAPVDATAGRVAPEAGTPAPAPERGDTPLRPASVEADIPADTELRAALSDSAAPPAQGVRAAPAEPATSPAATQVARVLERVEHMLHAGQTSIRVRLEPEWLGPVEIRVVSRPGGLEIDLIARTPEARDLLERDLGWLQQGLVENGHEVQRVRVTAPESLPDGTAGSLADQGGERGWQGHADAQDEADWRQSFRLYRLGTPERDAEGRPRAIAGQQAAPARGIDVRV